MRLFLGIGLDVATRVAIEHALQSAAQAAPSGVRMLPADNWHLTLQFLGTVADERVPALHEACVAAAATHAAFEIELGPAGAFKSPRSASASWIGVAHGAERIAALHETLHTSTAALGFKHEARAFSAHLTIARAKQPLDARPWFAALHVPPQRMAVTAFTLFQSHLSSHGARYEALEHFQLRAERDS